MNQNDKDFNSIPEPATLNELAAERTPEWAPEQTYEHLSGQTADEIAVFPIRPVLDDLGAVEELARLTSDLDAARERLLRQAAEFQNYRRRTELEKTQSVALGKSLVVQRLLDVVDDFERSIRAAESVGEAPDLAVLPDAFSALRQGVVLVLDKLRTELERLGVEEIKVAGVPFNEKEHEALMQKPAEQGEEPGRVVGELQKGYRMGDRIIRHAKVIVSA